MSSGINTQDIRAKIYCGGAKPAWHNHQNLYENYLNAQQARTAANLDWEPILVPTFAEHNGQRIMLEERAVLRDDTGMQLGSVKGQYTPFWNEAAFEFIDALLRTADGEVLIETAGNLWGGREIFILARKPESIKIAGDEVFEYFGLFNNHTGKRKVRLYPTNTRVVCANTLAIAEETRKRMGVESFQIPHRRNLSEQIEAAKEFFRFASLYENQLQQYAEQFLKVKIDSTKFEGIVNDLYPVQEDMAKRALTLQAEKRSRMWEAIQATDLENFRWTGWGVLQAFANVQSHAEPLRKTEFAQDQRILDLFTSTDVNALLEKKILAFAN